MKILVLHTLPPGAAPAGRDAGEFDLSGAAANLADALASSAVVAGVRGDPRELIGLIETCRPDVVFNACEAPLGRTDLEAHAAALFEWLGVPFTGSGSETLALCRRKDRTKAVLAAQGVPVPAPDRFPCIVKPADEDGSAHIDERSICEDAAAVERAVARLPGPALIEEFLPGPRVRRFRLGPLRGRAPVDRRDAFPQRAAADQLCRQMGRRQRRFRQLAARLPQRDRPGIARRARGAASGAWSAVGARGYLRVDIRLDARGNPRVLDVNPNPEIGPGVGICRAVEEAGWSFARFVRQQVEWACA